MHSPPSACCFETLFERYRDEIYRFLFKVTGAQGLAEDVMTETFVSFYKEQQKGTLIENPRSWLYRVAKRKAWNALRDQKRRVQRHQDATEANAEVMGRRSTDLERVLYVRQIMETLKPQQAMLLQLYHAGLSYEEIGDVMTLKPSSIGQLLVRAKKAFRQAIESEGTI